MLELIRHRDRVAHAHERLRIRLVRRADVDEQVRDLGQLAFLLRLHEMRRDVADDALHRPLARVDDHALRLGDDGIHPAELAHPDEALVINEVHHEGNLIGMSREHQARPAALVEHGDTVAVSIGKRLVGELLHIIEPDALPACFVAGGAGGVDQLREEGQ